ncbi:MULTISPECIES: hypothetical protein [Burkholderia]|uniref:hypothetical protein n=1 Tax=Burkholderia TaxID=32008 RepID=UPI00141FB605|nr:MULTISPECIES: hypothetical protein [Burkholderia]MCA7885517.1 hypothetical protein [Burkholderia contaminans]NIF54953.1 hypothetical protein [Burkholderia sp. Ax-1724]
MSKHYSKNRDVNDYISGLVRAGWTFTKGSGGHGKITAPNGRRWGVPSTPGDWRALPNLRRDLKHLAALPAVKTKRA